MCGCVEVVGSKAARQKYRMGCVLGVLVVRFDVEELEQWTYVYWGLLHVGGTTEGTRDRVSPCSLGEREREAGEQGVG